MPASPDSTPGPFGTPIFGEFSNQVEAAAQGGPVLTVDANVWFGGLTIKHDK